MTLVGYVTYQMFNSCNVHGILPRGFSLLVTKVAKAAFIVIYSFSFIIIRDKVLSDTFRLQCISHSWYLSAELQLYIIAPVLLILLYKSPKNGIYAAIIAIALGSVLCLFPKYKYNIFPSLGVDLLFESGETSIFQDWYLKAWYDKKIIDLLHCRHTNPLFRFSRYQHISPFAVGILAGYFLQMKSKPNVKAVWIVSILGLIVAFFAFLINNDWYNIERNNEPQETIALAYLAIYKLAWALGVAAVVLIVSTKAFSLLNLFYSCTLFAILGRLVLAIYMVHHIPIMLITYSTKYTTDLSVVRMVSH